MAGYGHAAALLGPTRAVPERLCSACGARFLAPRRARDFRVLCPDCVISSQRAQALATRTVQLAAERDRTRT